MNLSLGIVGLPNVGKSTLFNTLTNNAIPAENYPFCTIDPNIGIVYIPDIRIDKITQLVNPEKTLYPVVEFYDIAGLVKNAHKGEGLGNQFLAHIRNTSAIVQVVRSFKADEVVHVEKQVDPKRDKEIVETELILKDLESLQKRIEKMEKEEVKKDPKMKIFLDYALKIREVLNAGKLAITLNKSQNQDMEKFRRELFLLTDKSIIYLVNVDEVDLTEDLKKNLRRNLEISEQFPVIPMNIKQEFEISQLNPSEREEFRKELGLEFHALDELILTSYELLGLISFYTAGPKEVRGWTIPRENTVLDAAAAIHTDFRKKFIAADVVAYDDFVKAGGWQQAKEQGKVRLEGRDYVVKDADVLIIRHGA